MKRFIISYRGEFSTVIKAKNLKSAMNKAMNSTAYQWECIGELHSEYLQHETDHLSEEEIYTLEE